MTSARTESAALRRHRADLRKARNSNHSHLDDGRRSRGRALAAHTLQVGRAKTHLIASRCRLKNKNKKVKKLRRRPLARDHWVCIINNEGALKKTTRIRLRTPTEHQDELRGLRASASR